MYTEYKIINADYLRVDLEDSTFEIFGEQPPISTWSNRFALKDAVITIYENNVIKVSGDRIEWGYVEYTIFLENLKEGQDPDSSYIKYGYKNIVDYFRKIKSPFVNRGLYKLKKVVPYECVMSKGWTITNKTKPFKLSLN